MLAQTSTDAIRRLCLPPEQRRHKRLDTLMTQMQALTRASGAADAR